MIWLESSPNTVRTMWPLKKTLSIQINEQFQFHSYDIAEKNKINICAQTKNLIARQLSW